LTINPGYVTVLSRERGITRKDKIIVSKGLVGNWGGGIFIHCIRSLYLVLRLTCRIMVLNGVKLCG
jgi:hypothetical protein